MKTLTYSIALVLALAFSGFTAIAQIRKIPAEVTDSFTDKYPEATAVEWKDKLTAFAASFHLNDIVYTATFDNEGDWQVTEHNIDENQLPASVKEGYDKSKFTDWKINKVVYLEFPGDEVNYRVEVGKGDIKKRNLYFNSDGRLIKDKMTL